MNEKKAGGFNAIFPAFLFNLLFLLMFADYYLLFTAGAEIQKIKI
jgi:hypothetical protein